MHIVCIQLIIIINHLSFSLLVETKSYTNMCFANELIVEKSSPFTSDLTKLTIGELEDNCDYIDLEDRIKLNCDKKSLSLIQLNIRGLLSKSLALNLLLTENVGNIRPDLVLLCETWLNPNNLVQGFIRPVARVGSGDPVRVLRLYTTITLDEVCSIYC